MSSGTEIRTIIRDNVNGKNVGFKLTFDTAACTVH